MDEIPIGRAVRDPDGFVAIHDVSMAIDQDYQVRMVYRGVRLPAVDRLGAFELNARIRDLDMCLGTRRMPRWLVDAIATERQMLQVVLDRRAADQLEMVTGAQRLPAPGADH